MQLIKITGPINQDKLDFEEYPFIPAEEYLSRISKLMQMANDDGFTAVIVYGDREHFSNVCYLTGYDPRFEETLLVLKTGSTPKLVVGLEGEDYSKISPVEIDRHLYSGFGLQGQPQTDIDITNILMECGLDQNDKAGLIGWKEYQRVGSNILFTDIPHYLVEAIAAITGRENIKNVTWYMNDSKCGLRTVLSVNEIVQAEYINAYASRQVYGAISGLREGMSETDASAIFRINGLPMSTYPSMSFGEKNVSLGLASAMPDTVLRAGDIASVGLGYRHAMIHRSTFFVSSEEEFLRVIGKERLDFYKTYFKMITAWYESIAIGKEGGKVYEAIEEYIEPMGVKLNAGHMIHTEEWMNSLFYKGSSCEIKSGMAIQCDVIASSTLPFAGAHVEDGIVIADEALRSDIKKAAPRCYERIQRRRKFMTDTLNIKIADEVLPLSDIQGMLFVFMADSKTILTN